MSLFYIRFIFLLLLIYSTYVYGIIKLPLCQCECCPGEYCSSQLLVFSVDQCNETTCSFDECYKMYPKKCGLLPGITNTFCDLLKQTITTATTNSSITHSRSYMSNSASSNIILSNIILFCLFLIF